MNYEISDCRGVEPDQLCPVMNAAFSDYIVPMALTVDRFRVFQRQRGFSPEHSFIARSGSEIAAFWFSGRADARYGSRAYTLSVGTDPAHRRRQLAQRLLDAVVHKQRRDGAAGLQLEVVTSNERAIAAYETFGFRVERGLLVFKVKPGGPALPGSPNLTLEAASPGDLPEDKRLYFDTEPTPQNSGRAIRALWPDVHVLAARAGGELQGWAAACQDGTLVQIAVRRDCRRRGIGRALIGGICRQVALQELICVNVDEDATSLTAFLKDVGAEEILRQNELHLDF